MKKLITLLVLGFMLHLTVAAQSTASLQEKQQKAAEEIKAELVSKLSLSSKAADKVIKIENEFRAKLALADAATDAAEKDKQRHQAFVTRYGTLMDIPLTGRQMEDAIALIEQIRLKYKL